MTPYAADRYVSHFEAKGLDWLVSVTERGNNGPRLAVGCWDGCAGPVEISADEAADFAAALAHARQLLIAASGGPQ